MKIMFRKENLKLLISALVYLILGVCFCVFLNRMVDFAESSICFVFIVLGAVLILAYGLLPADGKLPRVLVYGVVCLVLGLLIFMVRKFFIIALAVMIAYGGIQTILDAVKNRNETKGWITNVVVGSVITALAVVLIILSGTNTAKNIIAIFLGIAFLIEAIVEIIAIIKLVKKTKMIEPNAQNVQEVSQPELKEESK